MVFTTLFALTLAAGAAAPAPAGDATSADAKYGPFMGCWSIDADSVTGRSSPFRLCVIARDGGGARLVTVSDDTVVSDETLIADDVARPTTAPGCKGTERAAWATSFVGIFRAAELTCGADTAPRAVSSVSFFRTDGVWIDVQVVGSDEQRGIRVRRYQLSDDQSLPASAGAGERTSRTLPNVRVPAWTVANVVEASGKLPTEGVEAAVTELDRAIVLKKKQLLALADGGVDERVIDLLIGLSYPEKFVVRRAGGGGGAGDFGLWTSPCPVTDLASAGPCLSMGWGSLGLWDPWAFQYPGRYRPFGFGSLYGPFAWSHSTWYYPYDGYYGGYYGGYYNGGYYNGGGVVTSPGGPVVAPDRPTRPGLVINGQGYTQVMVRQPTSTGTFGSRGGTNGDASQGGNTANSGVSSQGYSSGGAGGERTAVARPPQ